LGRTLDAVLVGETHNSLLYGGRSLMTGVGRRSQTPFFCSSSRIESARYTI
jgi:hypothetical protein